MDNSNSPVSPKPLLSRDSTQDELDIAVAPSQDAEPEPLESIDCGSNDRLVNVTCQASNITLPKHSTPNKSIRIDTEALNGLRGVLSAHIVIFHAVLYSKLQLDLLGSVQMSVFFLLSGYIFGLSEGKTKYKLTKCCTELKTFPDSETSDAKHFDGAHFYRRRIARTLPLYYLTNILCIPLIYVGYSWNQPGTVDTYITLILAFFVATTWFGKPAFLNGPSWFVSTIWFFYWIFPSLLPKLQLYDTKKKQKCICIHYWVQLVVALALIIPLMIFIPDIAFYVATFWPPSRLPLFIMGILTGLLRNDGIPIKASWQEHTVKKWKTKCDVLSIMFIIIFAGGSVVENMFTPGFGFWFQVILPWWQLQLINALTFDNGTSRTYKILTSKCMLQLGRISYALYLVHYPLMDYICWAVYGTQSMPTCERKEDVKDACSDAWDTYLFQRLMPNWCIPIHLCASFIIAIALNRLIEEPMRKWLRPPKKN